MSACNTHDECQIKNIKTRSFPIPDLALPHALGSTGSTDVMFFQSLVELGLPMKVPVTVNFKGCFFNWKLHQGSLILLNKRTNIQLASERSQSGVVQWWTSLHGNQGHIPLKPIPLKSLTRQLVGGNLPNSLKASPQQETKNGQ